MAEAMARGIGGERVRIESAGVIAQDGDPATPYTIVVARELGYDLTEHRARSVGDLDLGSYDWIVALTPEIATRLRDGFGVPNERLVAFDVDDPYGGRLDGYRECASLIEAGVRELLDRVG
jgi:protein arginine phosphatase